MSDRHCCSHAAVPRVDSHFLFSDKIFGHNWTPAYCVLHVDSFFVCYQHQGDTEPAGTVLLRSVAPLICIGGYTDRIPNRPKLPDNLSVANLIAIGNEDKSINWFAAETSDEFK